ncbi:MAG: RtcB family protein [Clostridia bacterium]|nr:RtcB family protein [Clostridia bacterium]
MEIKGQYATAVCYAKDIEPVAVAQIQLLCDQAFAEGSRIRIMPDVHAGKGCTIGTTMTIQEKAVPNLVGVDIGCGMYAVRLDRKCIDFAVLDEVCHWIPSGQNLWEIPQASFALEELHCFHKLRRRSKLQCALGTLGGGNHFIEVDRAEDGSLWLVIHSGSRNLGKQVCEYYQQLAVDIAEGKEDYHWAAPALIAKLKAEGREKEIQKQLDDLRIQCNHKTAPNSLCPLEGSHLSDYLHDVKICQAFAALNRETMASLILARTGLTALESFHTVHNYIDTEEMILRKGAIAAHAGERVLIPINKRDGSIIAIGRGSSEWNHSAPHGAGRIMSRKEARASLSLEAYRDAMKGIYTTTVSLETIDEAPMAYKRLEDITDVIRESVDIVEIIQPVYNFKAAEK